MAEDLAEDQRHRCGTRLLEGEESESIDGMRHSADRPGEPATVLPWMKRLGQYANLYHLTFRGTCLIIRLGSFMTRKNQEIAVNERNTDQALPVGLGL